MTTSRRSRWKLYDIQFPLDAGQAENINANFDRLYADLYNADYAASFVDGVLAPSAGGTGFGIPFVRGDILYANSTSTWARLAAGAANYVLKSNGPGLAPSWGALLHTLLDATLHSDTAAGTVARGDVITGQGATPKWTRLAKGTTGHFLRSDGTDVAWSNNGSALVSIPETAITDGALLARMAANEDVTGAWTFPSMAVRNTSGSPNGFQWRVGFPGTYAATAYLDSYYNGYKLHLKDISAAGSSYGLLIEAGKVVGDYVIRAIDRNTGANLFYLKGDGTYYFKGSGATSGAQNWARSFLMRAGYHG